MQQHIVWQGGGGAELGARSQGGQQGTGQGHTGPSKRPAMLLPPNPPSTTTTNRLDLPHERLEKTLPLTLCSAVHLALPGACPQGKERSCSDAGKQAAPAKACPAESLPDLGNHLPPNPQSNHCPFLSTSLVGTLIFSCCSCR